MSVRIQPSKQTRVGRVVECAAVQDTEGERGLDYYRGLVVVLEVCADAREVDQDWDVMFLEEICGPDAA